MSSQANRGILADTAILARAVFRSMRVSFINLFRKPVTVHYPNKPRVCLRFGGIENFDTVKHYVDTIQEEADDDYIGCRIDSFHYDTKKESRAGNYWFFLETSGSGAVRIHCSNMSLTELPSLE